MLIEKIATILLIIGLLVSLTAITVNASDLSNSCSSIVRPIVRPIMLISTIYLIASIDHSAVIDIVRPII